MTYLTSLAQWIVVKLVPLPDGKTNKIPVHFASGLACDAHDPANWTTYEAAAAVAAARPSLVPGFVITAADDVFCVDIDGALGPGGWSALALELVQALPGCMTELSQSGRGLHIWGRYPNPPAHRMKRTDLSIECYTELRFIAWGTQQTGTLAERCDAFPAFLAKWFPAREAVDAPGNLRDGPRTDWRGPTDDADLLRRALRSHGLAATFGGRATFADLWDRNLDVLSRTYPGDGDGGVDWSSADAALAQHLAFWTGCDQGRMLRLMQESGLQREKWEREDYLPRTIASACGMQREVLQDKPVVTATPEALEPARPAAGAGAVPPPPTAGMHARTEATFLTPEQQVELFRGCVYIQDLHRVMVPGGKLLKPDQFRATFGGRVFSLDSRNEKTTRNAFEALTENQAVACPIADGTSFRPDMPYGTIIESEGRRRANIWWPADVRMLAGDISRFEQHLQKLFPHENDRRYLTYWMANVVQHPGHKSQWMPLLVGAEGNGKSLISRCLSYAVGTRYTHWPEASKLGNQFNGWLYGKILICVEDLLIGDQGEVWERLKPMITGESLEIEGKGIDQRTDEIAASFIANSNFKNAVRGTLNDRRVCHLWCAQQTADDVKRDGMGEEYMSSIYDWLKLHGGYAAVAHWLATIEIPPEFGLNWFKGRAPRSSHHMDAVAAGLGVVEQEIVEAIEREEIGFRGGWVSSGAVDRLLDRTGRAGRVPLNRRREMLQALGYDWHPALPQGRVHNPVQPDGAKVKLFLKNGHADRSLLRPADVAAAYSAAQGVEAVRRPST